MAIPAAWLSTAGLILSMALFGSSFAAMKIALAGYSPMAVVWGRMFLAALVMLPAVRRFREFYRPGDWRRLALMGLYEPCLYFVFEAYALRYASASQAGMLTATLPAFVAAGARVVLGERSSGRVWAGFALAILGVFLLTGLAEETGASPNPVLGSLLEVMAMLCATAGIISVKSLSGRYPAILLTAAQAFAGAIFFLPAALFVPAARPVEFHLVPALAAAYLGLFVSILGYGLYNWGVSKIPASRASAYVNLVPVFSLAFGGIVLGERFTPGQYAASLLVFAGVWLSQSSARSRRSSAAS